MPRRRDRVPVVLDANVVLRALMDPRSTSASARVYRLWLQRRLQMVVSDELAAEYIEVLRRIGLRESLIIAFQDRLDRRQIITHVRPGLRLNLCRDPDDDMLLEVAQTGRARYLITNDRDLLEIPEADRQVLRFRILSPVQFMDEWDAGGR